MIPGFVSAERKMDKPNYTNQIIQRILAKRKEIPSIHVTLPITILMQHLLKGLGVVRFYLHSALRDRNGACFLAS